MKLPTRVEIESALEEFAESRAFYEAVTGTEVPTTLKGALADGWELVANGVLVEWLLAYKKRDRERDRQKLIPLEVALTIIEDWEEKLVRDQVLNSRQVTWRVLGVVPRLVEVVWANKAIIWEALRVAFDLLNAPSLAHLQRAIAIVWLALGSLLSVLLLALRPAPFQLVILSVLKDRDRVAKLMRSKVLFQGNGRVRRRKVSRR